MHKKHYPIAIILAGFVALSSLYLNSVIATSTAKPTTELVSGLSPSRYLMHVNYLASDEMKGRGSGSPELEKAADYIASQFRTWGLQPAGESGTYFQRFEVTTGTEFGPRNTLELDGGTEKMNEDFVPISFSGTAEFEGPVVFAGYGITAPEFHYDDYQGIDANGKIVVVFRHEPQELDPNSPFAGTQFTSHAAFINKAVNAKRHGAKAIIFITDPNAHTTEPDTVGAATRGIESDDMGISAVHARRAPVMAIFEKAGRDLAAVQKDIDTNLEPKSFEMPDIQIKIATEIIRVRKPVRNVLAAVPGSDPALRNEWIVVGAHYDHVGLGERNSMTPSLAGQIHHGADDNASGTAGVLELARLAAQNKQNFKRSVLFMTFAAEEIGLLGSSYFVAHPTVPLENIVGMLNLDMVGRVKNGRLFVGGVATSPNFRSLLEEFNESAALSLDFSESGFGSSDHTSFNIKRIPVLFFFSGLHADYHKPSDTADKINADDAIKVLSLVYMVSERIASDQARPQYTEVRQERPAGGSGAGGTYGTYFGSIPDFRDDLKGVLFADVRPDSPAAKGGLKAGDLMTEFDGKPVENLYDFTYALQAKKPGDVVVVVVKRGTQEIRTNITLEARR